MAVELRIPKNYIDLDKKEKELITRERKIISKEISLLQKEKDLERLEKRKVEINAQLKEAEKIKKDIEDSLKLLKEIHSKKLSLFNLEISISEKNNQLNQKELKLKQKEKELINRELRFIEHNRELVELKNDLINIKKEIKEELKNAKTASSYLNNELNDKIPLIAELRADIKKSNYKLKELIEKDLEILKAKEKELQQLIKHFNKNPRIIIEPKRQSPQKQEVEEATIPRSNSDELLQSMIAEAKQFADFGNNYEALQKIAMAEKAADDIDNPKTQKAAVYELKDLKTSIKLRMLG